MAATGRRARVHLHYLAMGNKLTTEGEALDTTDFPYVDVECLLYLNVCMRLDIALGALARYTAGPTDAHWKAALDFMRYLMGTAEDGVTFGEIETPVGYCDADYSGDGDSRQAMTGYAFLM